MGAGTFSRHRRRAKARAANDAPPAKPQSVPTDGVGDAQPNTGDSTNDPAPEAERAAPTTGGSSNDRKRSR